MLVYKQAALQVSEMGTPEEEAFRIKLEEDRAKQHAEYELRIARFCSPCPKPMLAMQFEKSTPQLCEADREFKKSCAHPHYHSITPITVLCELFFVMGWDTTAALEKHLHENYDPMVMFQEINQEKIYWTLKDNVEHSFSQLAPHNKQWVKQMARSYILYIIQYLDDMYTLLDFNLCHIQHMISCSPFKFWTEHMGSYMDLNFCFQGKPVEGTLHELEENVITVHAAHQKIQTLLQGMRRKQSPLSRLNQDLIKILVDNLQLHSYTGIPWSTEHYKA